MPDFGYLGSVAKVEGTFYMFTQYPVHRKTDQGPFCVATADRPEGPWTKYDRNPILEPGDWGAWDDGGYSEAGVRYNDGVFHWFYGGTKTHKMESIGYAYSFDGYKWCKYAGNPVIPLSRVPDASGFAEVKHLIEPPFIYIYHTLRCFSCLYDENGDWATEHLAVQVLSTTPNFRLPFRIMMVERLGPSQETGLGKCCPVSLESASGCALTVECTCGPQAEAGLRVHIRSTHDGLAYDSADLYAFDLEPCPGEMVRKTIEMASKVRFFKVTCENLDERSEVSNLQLTATVAS